jgi:hypothetical protein
VLAPLGGVLFVLGLATDGVLQIVLGILFVLLGVLHLVGTAVVVGPHEVQVKNPLQITMKRVPISSMADLRLDGKVLRRVSDDKKVQNLGWGSARASDVEELRARIAAAQSG